MTCTKNMVPYEHEFNDDIDNEYSYVHIYVFITVPAKQPIARIDRPSKRE